MCVHRLNNGKTEGLKGGFKEWVDGWVLSLQSSRGVCKLITVWGRFDPYKGGV